ncbi:MAG TPA: hypothetical protein VGK04_00925 [Thermoanaerobaculia bacterium]
MINARASRIGYFNPQSAVFQADESGVWKAQLKVTFDRITSAGPVQPPYPTGDVLGSRDGEFYFYVTDPTEPPLSVTVRPRTTNTAPAGTSVVVKWDRYGDTMRAVAAGLPYMSPSPTNDVIFGPIGPLAPLARTFVKVPLPSTTDGRVAIGSAGQTTFTTPAWIVRGSMNKTRFNAGETLDISANMAVVAASLGNADAINVSGFLEIERLTLADGQPIMSRATDVSSLLTPTGLAIDPFQTGPIRYDASVRFTMSRVSASRAEGSFELRLTLPASPR